MTSPDDEPTEPDPVPASADAPTDVGGLTGRVLRGRYVLEEHVASGASAAVWRGYDSELGRTVAVKVLHEGIADDTVGARRFHQEAIIAGRLPHPGIVAVFDAGVEDDVRWLALEHVDGPDLLGVLRHHPTGLDDTTAAAIVEQAAVALAVAHERGIVHGDVKPANVLMTRAGVVKISDFGVAAHTGDVLAEVEDSPVGTAAYAPPEQLAGGLPVDPRMDVFALGVVLFEALTGRAAFPAGGRPVDRARPLHPRRLRSDVPRALDALVARATDPDPEVRFRDASRLASALRPLVPVDPHGLAAEAAARTTTSVPGDGSATSSTDERPSTDEVPTATKLRWLGFVAAVLVAVVAATSLLLGSAGTPGGDDDVEADAGVPVRDVRLYDPYASVGGSEGRLLEVVDGDPATAWSTPAYPVPLRSLGTPGVGVRVDLGAPVDVRTLTLALGTEGVTVEVLVRDALPAPGSTEVDWELVARAEDADAETVLDVDGRSARHWLVWFTDLRQTGETWQASLTDLRFDPVDTP